jgi:tetratricopeptide (TPR) repeat protein
MPPRVPPTRSSRLKAKPAQVALLQKGIELQRQRRFVEAEYCYQSVLRESPRNPDALNLLGTLALEAKRPDEAAKLFEAAVRQLPNQPGYFNNLGTALIALGRLAEAERTLKQALKLDPDFVDALCSLGSVYRSLNKAHDATTCYERAIALAPGSRKAIIGLADLLVDNGDMERAEKLFRKVLNEDQTAVSAHVGLAMAHRFTVDDPEPAQMLDLLSRPLDDERQRAALQHSAGKALADQKQYDAAFEQFAASKALRTRDFDLVAYKDRHDVLVDGLDAAFFAERSGFGLDTEQPVFIVGMPRSGTTLTEQICSSHSEVAGAGELRVLGDIARELGVGETDPAVFVKLLKRMTAGQSRDIAKLYLEQSRQYGGSAARLTDKMPHNFEYLGLIQLLFPRARIIHCRRDPIDTCVSCFTHNFAESHGYNTDLHTLGLYYREYRRITDHWRAVLPLSIHDSSYEDLIADQEAGSRRLIAFLGLPWEPAVLDFHTNDRLVRTPSRWQVRQPIYSSAVKSWKRYEAHLGPLIESLGDLAEV